jgi:hypothetical protein
MVEAWIASLRDHMGSWRRVPAPSNHGPGRATLDGILDFPTQENRFPQVDIPGLIWYIRAFDEKGVAFSRPFFVS